MLTKLWNKTYRIEISILFLPILVKTPKEVNEISKFFKKNSQLTEKKIENKKSYIQASFLSSNIKEILKIKENFPNLQAKKIKNIQKVINNSGKPKLRINMTIKGPSRKQVIIPMNNENKINFIEVLSTHITNLNRVLKDIKFKVMADFV